MSLYRHILLALDFSEQARALAEKALMLSRQHGARLSVVHVLDNIAMPDTSYGTSIALTERRENPELETEKANFKQLVDEFKLDQENAWLVWGNPKQEIVALADKLKADLIVVGSHGRHGLQVLLGSTANAVLHHANCDVVAVRIRDA
ncbi:universal stress protein [Methylomarinum vadi]|uniref:universal stress protein n=1 Tax=Methylomarinum vadi TaxID=438855 RepID=UPI0004DEF25C|nr:universal stress protein [Methylomarinum vadi]